MLHVGVSMSVTGKISRFSKYQKSILERSFAAVHHLNEKKLNELILLTGLTKKQVCAWYKKKRWRTSMFIPESLCLLRIGNN